LFQYKKKITLLGNQGVVAGQPTFLRIQVA